MNKSPFLYGHIVTNQHFTNRKEEIRKLKQNLLQGINTMIISPRRWGKSSLVEMVTGQIRKEEPHVRVVLLDLFAVGNEKEFLETYARKLIKAVSGKWEDQIRVAKEFFKRIIPKITIGTEPQSEFSISFSIEDLKNHSDEILHLGEVLAEQNKIHLIVCIDEFQNLASFPEFERLEKKMRAVWHRHKHVTYCLYGSRRHLMENIFNDPSKPFYRFGDVMFLEKIDKQEWVKFIVDRFHSTGKQISESLAGQLAGYMKNHSWYIQQLAHYVWNRSDEMVSIEILDAALDEVIQANTPFFQKQLESLSTTQFYLLKAIMEGRTQLTGAATMREYPMGTPNNILKNKRKLLEEDIIIEGPEGIQLFDPVFELWLKRTLH